MRNRSVRWREPLCLFSPTYELGTSRAKFLFFSHEKNNYLAIEEPWKLNRTAAKLLLGIVEIARDERKIVQDAKTSLGLPVGRRIDARISFSSIEAVTYALKQLALAYEMESARSLSKSGRIVAAGVPALKVDRIGKQE